METEKRQKYFVNRKEVVAIKCRSCGRIGMYHIAHLKNTRHSLRIDCPCSRTFEVDLEFRRNYRQKSEITGSFRPLSSPQSLARQCVISDHSNGGLLLRITEEVPVKEDDQLIVCYGPATDAGCEEERIISVRHFDRGSRIGGAFLETPSLRQGHPDTAALH